MTGLVIDASVALAWCFHDERSAFADAALEALTTHAAHVPSIWTLEVANVLTLAVRRKRITSAQLLEASNLLRELPLRFDDTRFDVLWGSVQPIAQRFDLTVYDASYLELAMRLGMPLATSDERLRHAATAAQSRLFEAVA